MMNENKDTVEETPKKMNVFSRIVADGLASFKKNNTDVTCEKEKEAAALELARQEIVNKKNKQFANFKAIKQAKRRII